MKDLDIKAIMIHGRTLAQGFSGEIDYETIKKPKNMQKVKMGFVYQKNM